MRGYWRSNPDGSGANNINDHFQKEDITKDKQAEQIKKENDEQLYPREIAGVKRNEPKTFEQMMQQGVNPKYMSDEDIDGEYSDNCQSCTVAAELVIRGYDVEAVGASNLVAQRLKSSNETAYISPITGKKCAYDIIFTNEISCYDYLEKNVKMGERYELSYNSPTESGNVGYDKEHEKDGHVVLVTRDEQYGLMYYDPQDNKTLSGEQVRDYISTWFQYKEPVRAPRILRIDDKLLNPNYVNHVVRRRNGF